jgi:RimJ/RimL family protein N-acetyltransferase
MSDRARWLNKPQTRSPARKSNHATVGTVNSDNLAADLYGKQGQLGAFSLEANPAFNGIASAAVVEMPRYAFAEFPLERLEAMVFEWNPASRRVLEKAGYTLEARLARSIVKDGRIGDGFLYALLRH